MENCNKNPIKILNISKIINGILKFKGPSWDFLKSLILLCILLKKVKLANLKE